MRRILITFLGRVRKQGDFYEPAAYDFGAGSVIEATYMGDALLKHLRKRGRKVDLVVLLGTRSSMWDALVERLSHGDGFEDERLALIDKVGAESVDQPCLDNLAGLMSQSLGAETRPRLVNFARDEGEQVALLFTILEAVGALSADDELLLDVTHGFRHFPMLGMLAAMYFEVAAGCKIDRIYYGANDMRDAQGKVPVLRLDGLVQLGRWIRALHAYNKDGDFGPFVPLLKKDKVISDETGGEALWRLAYFERTGQVSRAQEEAARFRTGAGENWTGISGLFERELLEHLPRPGEAPYHRLRDLALRHFEHEDYLRAAILGFEALNERVLAGRPIAAAEREAERGLRNTRNALAHADDQADGSARGALPDPKNLKGFLRNRLSKLLP